MKRAYSIDCVFAGERKLVYEIFESEMERILRAGRTEGGLRGQMLKG